MRLYDKILSEQNIYNAIFCLKSYVGEKGLLDTKEPIRDSAGEPIAKNDLELYYALLDEYDTELMDKVIGVCLSRLKVLFEDPSDLFEVSAYFRMKKVDENGELKFRPIHTARLTDLICMVSILDCLMFDDAGDNRSLTDLAELIPGNFYGNVLCTDMSGIFKDRKTQYKKYSDITIERQKTYRGDNSYHTEVRLDIEDFFPSVSPMIMYEQIIGKISNQYDADDSKTLKTAVAKLLFVKLKEENIKPWIRDYYEKECNPVEGGIYLNRGLTQGLPQSYFFANLCMVTIQSFMMSYDCFEGDAYFYVDDSIVFIKSILDKEDFNERIDALNKKIEDFCCGNPFKGNYMDDVIHHMRDVIPENILSFQNQLLYEIKFHKFEKSSFCEIGSNDVYSNLFGLTDTSMTSGFLNDSDEADDDVLMSKYKAISEVVEAEIERITSNKKKGVSFSSNLKRLHRINRYYINKRRILEIMTQGKPELENLSEFKNTLPKLKELKEWLENRENDLFQNEYRTLIKYYTQADAEKLYKIIEEFESEIALGKREAGKRALFYSRDAEASVLMRKLEVDHYKSIVKWVKENHRKGKDLKLEKEWGLFIEFLETEFEEIKRKGLRNKGYTAFVAHISSEFQRRILNAYFSYRFGVEPSDDLTFIKPSGAHLCYVELRILTWLRNRKFVYENFRSFVKEMQIDVPNKMQIDMALLGVLNIFINSVCEPKQIDNLIRTHRITKGLWLNGSKFLHSYTLHNEEHAVKLIDLSVRLVKRIKFFSIEQNDYYILFLACYLHDISMVIYPDLNNFLSAGLNPSGDKTDFANIVHLVKKRARIGRIARIVRFNTSGFRYFLMSAYKCIDAYFEKSIRDSHPKASAKFIRDKSRSLFEYLDDKVVEDVAAVSESHGDGVDVVYVPKSEEDNGAIALQRLKILLRLADLLDVASDRVNYDLLEQNSEHMRLVSRFHWISHLVTDKIEVTSDYESAPEKELLYGPITKKIDINFKINIKGSPNEDVGIKCKNCQCDCKTQDNRITIEIKDAPDLHCNISKCPFLCLWMMKKNNYLRDELVALRGYLNDDSNPLIKTAFSINIDYSDQMELPQKFYDDVRLYLFNENKPKATR